MVLHPMESYFNTRFFPFLPVLYIHSLLRLLCQSRHSILYFPPAYVKELLVGVNWEFSRSKKTLQPCNLASLHKPLSSIFINI